MTIFSSLTRLTRAAITLAPVLLMVGCGSLNNMLEGDRLDYRSATRPSVSALEIPPDLSTLPRDDRFSLPGLSGPTTLSSYSSARGAAAATRPSLLPSVPEARLERAGTQRWLVVNRKPEEVWPVLKEFWQDMGFLVRTESQETGILETDWAENRAKIPQDFVRNTIGRVLEGMYSTGERDKFRTRLERTPDGNTEVYISHRGMIEVLTGPQSDRDSTVWQPRPADPELEAEFLRRLLVRFGVEGDRARSVVAGSTEPPKAKLIPAGTGPAYVEVDEGFERAWRRVGLALDRVGFTVEDRDRTRGIYFVRYIDPELDNNAPRPGLLRRLFSRDSSEDRTKSAMQYRITVKGQTPATSQVLVQNKDGGVEASTVGTRILNLLNEQLR